MVRLVTPDALPHGPVLSYAALQARFSGHKKAAGPMIVPSSPSPCAAKAMLAAERAAMQEENCILRDWESLRPSVQRRGNCKRGDMQRSVGKAQNSRFRSVPNNGERFQNFV